MMALLAAWLSAQKKTLLFFRQILCYFSDFHESGQILLSIFEQSNLQSDSAGRIAFPQILRHCEQFSNFWCSAISVIHQPIWFFTLFLRPTGFEENTFLAGRSLVICRTCPADRRRRSLILLATSACCYFSWSWQIMLIFPASGIFLLSRFLLAADGRYR